MADTATNPLTHRLARTEGRWFIVVLSMLGVMMAIIVVTGALHARGSGTYWR